jgi:sialate O-acetylesterase
MRRCLAFLFVLLPSVAVGQTTMPADRLTLADPFTDHMVLQRELPVNVFGRALPLAEVRVEVAGQSVTSTADARGQWLATLEPLEAGGPHEMTVASVGHTVTLRDVLVGEVWLASGQSNMQWPVKSLRPGDVRQLLSSAGDRELRLFRIELRSNETPQSTVENTGWQLDDERAAAEFSAVAYHFGRELRAELGVPVGIVQSAFGGTSAEAWTPAGALERDDAARRTLSYSEDLPDQNRPGWLFNGMIAPIVPMTWRGVIWYQGENNASRHEQYRTLFPLMIESWREVFRQPALPFGFVQLASFMPIADHPTDVDWARLRDAQRHTLLTVPHTGMAVAIDIGEADDIHPRNKKDVGLRLARWALHDVYDRPDVVPGGPLFDDAAFDGNRAIIRFTRAAGLATRDGAAVGGFTLAGDDRVFHRADAVIDGDTVIVSSDAVANPVAVRYAWAANPADANLVNAQNLPAGPFRTDDWPQSE